ncbi:MAG TPA: universal stress protein [Acidimicrobiales bacterium]|nr:universal stress protein [Acidimicrobiales bacterium]
MKILIALDESPVSLRAAREAGRLFGDADYLVVNVTRHVVPWVAAGGFGTVYPIPLTELRPSGLDEEELRALVEHVGIEASEVLPEFGDPATAVCDAAEEYDVDVVVVGSHDKGVLRRLLDPSVAQAVVRGTDRPVLVVSGPVE